MSGTYIAKIGAQIRSAVPAPLLPDGNSDGLFLIYAVLVLAKGEGVNAADVHNAWAAWMSQVDPAHESIRPYGALDDAVRKEDDPYLKALQIVARQLAADGRESD